MVGKQCPQRRSAKERRAETAVLDSLREEGFIQRPVSRAAFGISYDIVTDDLPMLGQHCRPPPRLAKLERRKKKKKELTAEQLAAKMEKTETRRKVGIHALDIGLIRVTLLASAIVRPNF